MNYWIRREQKNANRRKREWERAWHVKRHKTRMLMVSNLFGPCSECGHKHWPCSDPHCNDIFCGGGCRDRSCKCRSFS